MTPPPTRPEPFDPRDYPDPLTVMGVDLAKPGAERTVLVRRDPDDKLRVLREQRRPRRLGCSIFVVLVLAILVATPRSAIVPTATSPGSIDVRPGSAGPSTPPPGASGPSLSGAPLLVERDRVTPTQVSSGTPQPRAEAPVPSPSGESSGISSGIASWFDARGYQGAVPWWRPGQDPVWASVCRFADGRSRCVTVLITGFCQCLAGTDAERAIDLSRNAFEQLADPGLGLIVVQIEIPVQGPRLPATDGAP